MPADKLRRSRHWSLPVDNGAMTLMQKIREVDPEVPVILVTGHGDVQLAVKAMREGAYDFIEKPFTAEMLAGVIRRAMERRGLVLENRLLKAVAGKDVAIKVTIDPSILSGLIVKMGSRQIDTSLKTKLNSLKLVLKEVG